MNQKINYLGTRLIGDIFHWIQSIVRGKMLTCVCLETHCSGNVYMPLHYHRSKQIIRAFDWPLYWKIVQTLTVKTTEFLQTSVVCYDKSEEEEKGWKYRCMKQRFLDPFKVRGSYTLPITFVTCQMIAPRCQIYEKMFFCPSVITITRGKYLQDRSLFAFPFCDIKRQSK